MEAGRKRKVELSYKQKLEILDKLVAGRTAVELSKEYQVDRSCISRIKSNAENLRAKAEKNENLAKKRERKSGAEDLESVLFSWFTQLRARNAPVSGPMLLEKACQLSITMNSSYTPNAFKKKTVPVPYFFNKKAWMTCVIFQEILLSLDRTMVAKNRKILLLCDNAACHKLSVTLQNITVKFLPPNVTSVLQPLDQGIIRSVKSQYRGQLLRQMVIYLDQNNSVEQFAKGIDLLKALFMLRRAFFLLTPQTIQNCFIKAGIMRTDLEVIENDIQETIIVPADVGLEVFTDFVNTDENIECYGELSDLEIIEQFQTEPIPEENSDNDDEIIEDTISANDALSLINKLKGFFNKPPDDLNKLNSLESSVECKRTFKQVKITDLFNKS